MDVAQVSGWIDPVLADFVLETIETSERTGPEVLILQVDSPGSLVDDDTFDELVVAITDADVPIAVWVGDSGSRASRAAGRLVEAADVAGMAPRTRVDVDGRTFRPGGALKAGVVDLNQEESAVLGTFIAALDGEEVDGRELDTADFEEQEDGPPTARLNVQSKLAKLDLWPRLMHSFASPPVAYLLLAAGLVLLVFELFTGGIGIAGGVGALSLVLGSYGLAVLPTNPVGVALLVLGMFGFAVDVQTGVPRVWTGIGLVAFVVGSVVLYDDPVSLGWIPLVAGVVGVLLMMLGGLPATVRSRFSTPTIGRESMVGEVGEAVADVEPDGVVRIRGALWPAHANRSTPVTAGQAVRVIAIDGPRLQVEPVAESGPKPLL
ncbi:MAG TPA: NfeD family protein [Acidimicrobiales bacterium]|nr:NfeD family protein [Acidimicrobiales bacterium]